MSVNISEVDTMLFIQPGAPMPMVLASEYKLNLYYYYYRKMPSNSMEELPIKKDIQKENGIANMSFKNYFIYKFGYPNAEALQAHPYYPYGLEPYKIFEIKNSDWVKEFEIANRIHPFHNPIKYKMYKHFVLTFEDSTFECICSGVEIEFLPSITMKGAFNSFGERYFL